MGAHKFVSAVSAEIVDGTLPEKRFSPSHLRHNVPIRKPESAGRPHGGGGAYRATSPVSAVMLARIGPVKTFFCKSLIVQQPSMRPHGTNRQRAATRSCSEACAASAGARPMY